MKKQQNKKSFLQSKQTSITPNEQVHQSYLWSQGVSFTVRRGKSWTTDKVLLPSELHLRVCGQSVCVDVTRVRSSSLSSDVHPQKVFVARRTAQPRFAKVDRTGEEQSVSARTRGALCWDIDVTPPPPAPPGCE